MKRLLPFVFLLGACVPAKECRERVQDARDTAWSQCREANAITVADDQAKTERLRKFNQIDVNGKLISK